MKVMMTLLKGGDDLSITLERTPRRLSSYKYPLQVENSLYFVLRSMNIPS